MSPADVVVASPVEDFFLMIDGLPAASKVEAEKLTGIGFLKASIAISSDPC